MKKKVIFLVSVLMMILPMAAFASSSTWWTYGKDQQRTHNAVGQHTQPPLYLKWKISNIGWSISQPIVANGYIFHQAGGYLYKIPLNLPFTEKSESVSWLLKHGARRVKISNNYNARSHPVYDQQTHSIYVGTADNLIRKINPNTMRIESTFKFSAGRPLVDAPTILGKDLTAFGDGNAQVYLLKGDYRNVISLASPSSKMVVTGTFGVKQEKHPIIFIPMNFKGMDRSGYVDAYQVIDHGSGKAPTFKYVWSKPFIAENGVPTSTVYDKQTDRVYFTDKSGTVYAINAKNGHLVWKNKKFRSASAASTLVNNSPALSGHTLVVPIRYHNGRGHGIVAAFDTRNGHLIWSRTSAGKKLSTGKYNGEISNDPVIDADKNGHAIVLVGTTKGDLRTFSLSDGSLHFITKSNGDNQFVLHAVSGGQSSIYQGQGLATEITVADGHIIFGANTSATPNAKGTNGTLYAYSTPTAYPNAFKDLSGRVFVQDSVMEGLPLRVYTTPTNEGNVDIKGKFSTRLYVNGVMVDEKLFNGLKQGEEKGSWTKVPPLVATNTTGMKTMKFVVDYYDEINERVETNNVITDTYKVISQPPINCPNGGTWNGNVCMRTWTETHRYPNRTRAILIPPSDHNDSDWVDHTDWGVDSEWNSNKSKGDGTW